WMSFGDVKAAGNAHGDLFMASAEKVPMMLNESAFDSIKSDFKAAVEAKVQANLENNRNYVMEEMKKLGISGGDKDDPPTPDQDKKLAETQKLADEAGKCQKAKAMLQTIKIGTKLQVTAVSGGGPLPSRVPVTYSPHGRPTGEPGFQVEKGEGFSTYEEVDKEYKAAEATLAKILAENPAVYALISENEELGIKQGDKALEVGGAKPEDARKA